MALWQSRVWKVIINTKKKKKKKKRSSNCRMLLASLLASQYLKWCALRRVWKGVTLSTYTGSEHAFGIQIGCVKRRDVRVNLKAHLYIYKKKMRVR